MRVTQQLQLTSEKDSANIPHFGASDVVPAFVVIFLAALKLHIIVLTHLMQQ